MTEEQAERKIKQTKTIPTRQFKNRNNRMYIMEKIAEELNITLSVENKINDSFNAGNEIFLGEYEDEELKLISFFHELGHIKLTRDFVEKWNFNTLIIELECWNIGIEEARKRNILFSDKAIRWGLNKVLTYVGHDEREVTDWPKNYGSLLWINK